MVRAGGVQIEDPGFGPIVADQCRHPGKAPATVVVSCHVGWKRAHVQSVSPDFGDAYALFLGLLELRESVDHPQAHEALVGRVHWEIENTLVHLSGKHLKGGLVKVAQAEGESVGITAVRKPDYVRFVPVVAKEEEEEEGKGQSSGGELEDGLRKTGERTRRCFEIIQL
ncbi:hypothetical protein HPB47_018622 [Ixodes persulcatus]|uniref:Uncharacterized protein n=1 Tax=Ixodes persulcatus TaxID=34615 RepID=A0AC60QL37_IXOPE|nr:hypothetical protein HPB47_018622 [Ixodes persulcatus]